MKLLDYPDAFKASVEITKILCANLDSNESKINAASASQIADFIETLYRRFTGETESDS